MSFENDMFHPPVGMDVELQTNLKQKFVEDAFALLVHHQIHKIEHDVDGSISGFYRATDRFDIMQDDGSSVGIRLRFAEDPEEEEIQACAKALDAMGIDTDTGGVTLIAFEHCTFDTSKEIPEERNLEWRPYILIMLVSNVPEPLVVLNGESGEPLNDTDLLQATSVLYALRDHLNCEMLLEALVDQDADQHRVDDFGNRDFEPGEFIDGNECSACGSGFAYCQHKGNTASLN